MLYNFISNVYCNTVFSSGVFWRCSTEWNVSRMLHFLPARFHLALASGHGAIRVVRRRRCAVADVVRVEVLVPRRDVLPRLRRPVGHAVGRRRMQLPEGSEDMQSNIRYTADCILSNKKAQDQGLGDTSTGSSFCGFWLSLAVRELRTSLLTP